MWILYRDCPPVCSLASLSPSATRLMNCMDRCICIYIYMCITRAFTLLLNRTVRDRLGKLPVLGTFSDDRVLNAKLNNNTANSMILSGYILAGSFTTTGLGNSIGRG